MIWFAGFVFGLMLTTVGYGIGARMDGRRRFTQNENIWFGVQCALLGLLVITNLARWVGVA